LLLCELRDTKSALERRDDTLTQSEAIVQSLRQERDVLKTSLLELEIANHEQQNTKKEDREKIKIECAKLTTEKETLEMTLDLRDKELKAKKEEYRKDLVRRQHQKLKKSVFSYIGLFQSVHEQRKLELEHDVESKCSRIGAVEAELLILKEKFSESSHNLTTAEADVANLENSVQCLESFVKERDSQLSALKGELEEERKTCFGSALALSELEDRFAEATSDNEKVVLELGEIAKRKEELEATCGESEAVVQKFKAKVGDLEERIKESEVTFDARVESSKLVRDMKKKLLEAEDDLADKKKVRYEDTLEPSGFDFFSLGRNPKFEFPSTSCIVTSHL
jgi:chromosome segregation ATPase